MMRLPRPSQWTPLILALPGCVGGSGVSGSFTPACAVDADSDGGTVGLGCGSTATDAGTTASGGDATPGTDSTTAGPRTAAQVCARWNADRQMLDEGTWSGNLAKCTPGALSDAGRANTLTQVNLMRYLAQLPEVLDDPDRNTTAQACALMMHANNTLSHTPPTTWKCYTAAGANGAKTSNLSSGPSVSAVQSYMIDNGANNAKTLGHRRWILSNSLGPIGIGGTSGQGSSCLLVIGGKGKFKRPYTAWPAPGLFPIQAMSSGAASIDQTGWSVQTDQVNLGTSKVTVSANGQELPVVTTVLGQGYGAQYALSFKPQGWKSQAGVTYHVTVDKVGPAPWTYDVQMVDCASAP